MSVAELLDLVSKGGVITLLVIWAWGFYTEKWVSGATYQRALKERDTFRDELFMTLRVADRATGISERAINTIAERSSHATHLEAERRLRSINEQKSNERT